jgi:tRNA dimethylallyltransferase
LYIKAFCEGLDEIPAIPAEIRSDIVKKYNENGISWLQDEISKHDPDYSSTGETLNPQRMMRALEVKLGTGKSIRRFQQNSVVMRDFNIIKIALELPRNQLYDNIHRRVDSMIQEGLLSEVKLLHEYSSLPALRTVGYKELFDHLEGAISLVDAIDLIKKNTRHYAKRQLTWFKKDQEITWFQPVDIERIKAFVKSRFDV